MKVLVTGADGYLGSHVMKKLGLEQSEYDVFGATRKEADLTKPTETLSLVRNFNPSAIVHCAGSYDPGSDPNLYKFKEMSMAVNLATAAPLARIVFMSTSCVYGSGRKRAVAEKDVEQSKFTNAYGDSKREIEKYLLQYFNGKSTHVFNLRLFTIAGVSGGCGGRLFSSIVKKKIETGEHFHINGRDYDTPDRTCVRDYVHIDDFTEAVKKCLDYKPESVTFGAFKGAINICSGVPTSNLQVVDTLAWLMGKEAKYSYGNRREGDPSYLVGNNQMAKETINWQPQKHLHQALIDS